MTFKRNIVMILIMLMVGTVMSPQPVFAESVDKMELQEKTFSVLDQFDRIILNSKSLNALFTDQSQENFDMYESQFCLIYTLVERMNDLQNRWEKRIKKDRNDKVLRAFAATIQLAMYSIYSRPERYMGFMKVFKKADRQVKCYAFLRDLYEDITLRERSDFAVLRLLTTGSQAFNQPNPAHFLNFVKQLDLNLMKRKGEQGDNDQAVLSYRDRADDWEIKAASILDKAKGNIRKALELDPHYADGQILDVQVLVLEGKYREARDRFAKLEAMELFKEKRSLLNSWQAYMQLIEGKQNVGKTHLRQASAYSEPVGNSDWALEYLRLFKRAQTKWVVFNYLDFDLLKDGDLEDLRKKSFDSINGILIEMAKPLSGLPARINDKDLERLSRGHRKLFYTLDSDPSNKNLKKYSVFLENLYAQGKALVKSYEKWDELTNKNDHDVAFFYLLNKANCAFVLYYMLENTIELLDNDLLNFKLDERQKKQRIRKKINYRSQWKRWLKMVKDSLPGDIEILRELGKESIYFNILDFEYQALFGDADVALQKLEDLTRFFETQNRRQLKIQLSTDKIRVKTFVISWKSFLLLKKGNYNEAEEIIEDVEDWTLLKQWKENQENLIFIKSQPVPQPLGKTESTEETIGQ